MYKQELPLILLFSQLRMQLSVNFIEPMFLEPSHISILIPFTSTSSLATPLIPMLQEYNSKVNPGDEDRLHDLNSSSTFHIVILNKSCDVSESHLLDEDNNNSYFIVVGGTKCTAMYNTLVMVLP